MRVRIERWNSNGQKVVDYIVPVLPQAPLWHLMQGTKRYMVHIFSTTGEETHYTKIREGTDAR